MKSNCLLLQVEKGREPGHFENLKKFYLVIVIPQFKKMDKSYFVRTFEWMYGEALSRTFTH